MVEEKSFIFLNSYTFSRKREIIRQPLIISTMNHHFGYELIHRRIRRYPELITGKIQDSKDRLDHPYRGLFTDGCSTAQPLTTGFSPVQDSKIQYNTNISRIICYFNNIPYRTAYFFSN